MPLYSNHTGFTALVVVMTSVVGFVATTLFQSVGTPPLPSEQ
ncbi:MAG: hypothetical protein M0Z54_13385 [Thermaerobacter sp.]|nr:hypothetical protein [Thermaerobacter sp.]